MCDDKMNGCNESEIDFKFSHKKMNQVGQPFMEELIRVISVICDNAQNSIVSDIEL